MKIAVVFDTLHPDWEDADYKRALAERADEAEYDVARALMANGHDVQLIGVHDRLAPLLEQLAQFQPKIVFNNCEGFGGHAQHEYVVAGVLEMYGFRYTGSSPTALLVARNKSLTKKVLSYHGIRIPAFAEFAPGEKPVRPSELRFPLIVKPMLEDASVGIAQASVVEDDASLVERVRFVHEKFNQAAIVEELIEGRELYVGLVGNATLETLPFVELTFGEDESGAHRIATYKAKWDEEYRKRKRIRNTFAKGLSDQVATRITEICATAFRALRLQDYGRVDLRLTHDDEVYVLEVNPNPFLARENEMADAAARAGMAYEQFVQRIVDEALRRDHGPA
ncbi:MAG TPA: ATP-grasp domain-containing protein [Gemmatimonadales bacterium]|nr:ATP-grasp domain-containing protein [Gemmatimonadales bacterium]